MLTIENLSVKYAKKIAIKSVNFKAYSGKITGLIGADGAGKSSILHSIAGVINFDGKIFYNDILYKNPKEAEKIKQEMGLMPQGIGLMLYGSLSIEEHLDFFADIRSIKKDEEYLNYKNKLLNMTGLLEHTNRLAKNLSGGMMQKLALICTLIHKPKLLILDEPTTGVDPLSRLELWAILREVVKKENIICLVSTAYMDEAQKMDSVMLFDNGEMIASGKSNELIDSVKEFTYVESNTNSNTDNSDNTIHTTGFTYSLSPLNLKKQEPTLESLFFVNSLRQNNKPLSIEIKEKPINSDGIKNVMKAINLTKKFNSFVANDNVSMELKSGEIVGLLGANGAGKTTFLKMLLGLISIDSGELYLLDKNIKDSQDRQGLKRKIGYVSQHFSLYKKLTLRENLLYFASMHHTPKVKALEMVEEYSRAFGFYGDLDEFPPQLPLGINQRLSIAAALMHEPAILFLDEPTSGVDAIARSVFWKIMEKLKVKWNISILITTHYMSEASNCDRVVLLKDGKKVADNSVEELYKLHPNANNFEDIFLAYCDKPTGGIK